MSVYQLVVWLNGMKTIHVSDEVWETLFKLRVETRARSMDEVLRRILNQLALLPPGQQTSSPADQTTETPRGQNTLSADQIGKVPDSQPAHAEAPRRGRGSPRRSGLDDIRDAALVRNVRNPEALVRAAEARGLVAHDFSAEGFPGVVAVLTRSFVEFAKSVAEAESPQPSAVESAAVELLRGRRRLESTEDKVLLALYVLNREGTILWDGSRWVEPGRAGPAPPLSERAE
jgi:hypothetical protein